ncbi:sulfite exporter TauE/SafE family protein [Streptomyces sp. NPDC005492]|uniref:sulfite exporter TauE/SafE family protein n=1 Tax=Streptomyces sp. NPDC005492 TaxID=3156883 RepID=UPI0033A1AFBE
MPDISLTMVAVLYLTALAAGWIDAVVGGGGLLLLPVLLLGLPAGTPAATALGTNKAVAIAGTSGAAVTYARKTPVNIALAVRIGLAALAGSSAGAFFAAGMSTDVLKPTPAPPPATRRRILAAIGLAGLGIGFYDGLVGPGTFLVRGPVYSSRLPRDAMHAPHCLRGGGGTFTRSTGTSPGGTPGEDANGRTGPRPHRPSGCRSSARTRPRSPGNRSTVSTRPRR